ncbi:hypothetical protein EGW08_015386 [Elysia chlorotica]|uniref:Uncharacterized protein n=1 Tax=Elysia chlorotica TaxID=188477 RepID=A0A433T5L0_ELYCH|nr:hypothetical protein EGW08_015386 [Elysia chlorotica]
MLITSALKLSNTWDTSFETKIKCSQVVCLIPSLTCILKQQLRLSSSTVTYIVCMETCGGFDYISRGLQKVGPFSAHTHEVRSTQLTSQQHDLGICHSRSSPPPQKKHTRIVTPSPQKL